MSAAASFNDYWKQLPAEAVHVSGLGDAAAPGHVVPPLNPIPYTLPINPIPYTPPLNPIPCNSSTTESRGLPTGPFLSLNLRLTSSAIIPL